MSDQIFNWSDTSRIPKSPGIYAWYYKVRISEFDLVKVISNTTEALAAGNQKFVEAEIATFLERFVLRYFREEEYEVSMSGPLKPTYKGSLEHKSVLSNSLLERLAADPKRLFHGKLDTDSTRNWTVIPRQSGQ